MNNTQNLPNLAPMTSSAIAVARKFPGFRNSPVSSRYILLFGPGGSGRLYGGYNTVTVMLLLARKGLIIPRTYPRKEQLIRAEKLQEMGLVRTITPEKLNIITLYKEITSLLGSDDQPLADARRRQILPLDGASKLVADCLEMALSPAEVQA